MTSIEVIKKITAQKNIVIVGVSRLGNKTGNLLYKELKARNYNVFQINPNADEINGEKCYRNFESLPNGVTAAVLTVQPSETKKVIMEAIKNGINNIWLQNGSGNDETQKYCEEKNLSYVYNECILMYCEPVTGVHKFHGWIWKLIGKYAK